MCWGKKFVDLCMDCYGFDLICRVCDYGFVFVVLISTFLNSLHILF